MKSVLPLGCALLFLGHAPAWGAAILAPSDQILGGQENPELTQFVVGTVGTVAATNNWPGGEAPERAIDGVAGKYLNFGMTNTGILVKPTFNGGNGTVVSSLQLWTANDAEPRDPASYQLWGTNTDLDFAATTFDMTAFTQISSGNLALPAGRGGGGATALNNANSQTVTFSNTAGYKNYLLFFPTIKGAANSMQIGEVQLFGLAAFTSLTWAGTTSNVWNIETTANWNSSGSPSTYSDTNGVVFNDTGAPSRTDVVVQAGAAGVKPAVVVFQNNTLNYTISGDAIKSTGSLTVEGTGTVTLNNVNSYENGTAVNAGTLNVGPTGSLGAGSLTVNNANTGAGRAVTVNFNSAQSIGSLSGSIATPVSGVNTATINLNGNLTVTQTVDATYAGAIGGTGGLIKEGAADLTLTGVNTYAGATVINSGVLRSSAPGDNAQGALPAGQPVTVNAGATLILGADDGLGYHAGRVASLTVNGGTVLGGANTHSTLPNVTLNGGSLTAMDGGNLSQGAVLNYILDGNVTTVASSVPSTISASAIYLRNDPLGANATAPVTFNVPRGTAPVDLTVSSAILDRGSGLIKAGTGILALSNTNGYTGPTVINAGTIAVTNSAALGVGSVTINNGGALSLGAAANFTGFSAFALNGGATVDGTGAVLTLTENMGSQARSVFSPTAVSFAEGFTTTFAYSAGGNRAADGFAFVVQGVGPNAVGGGGGQLGYVGIANSAALEFNIYTGNGNPIGTNFAVGTAGTYIPSTPVDLASGDPILITVTYDPVAATLTETLFNRISQESYTNVFNGVDFAASVGSTSGFVGFTGGTGGAFASQRLADFSFTNFAEGVVMANTVSIPAGATVGLEVLSKSVGGAGLATLEGAVSMGANSVLNVTGGATVTDSPYSLSSKGAVTLGGNTTVNVMNNGTGMGSLTLTGAIGQSSASALTKTGPGMLTVGGAATYSGATTVNGGTLMVQGSISGASTTVNTGATLGGTGTLTGVTLTGGGTLAPGAGLGTISTGALSFQSGSTLSIEIGAATSDRVNVGGAATLAGSIALALSLLADPVDGTTFTLLDTSSPLIGPAGGARFSYLGSTLTEGQQFTVASGLFSQDFVLSYAADSGRDVTLLAVPEPAAATLLSAGLVGLLGLRRRRSR
ncbi:MAG TPA: autotransporter-associated beta strand repeat-containing protein [Glaciihabitans sp.]|nr:autotransporter-associated beta strand repeat-containing protein [Glaciihabitans sp.]